MGVLNYALDCMDSIGFYDLKVLDYLAVAEVIDSMEDLVQFLRDLSPSLSRVAREVSARTCELTHRAHAEILTRCLEQVKSLAPILICSMKIYIHILSEGLSTLFYFSIRMLFLINNFIIL